MSEAETTPSAAGSGDVAATCCATFVDTWIALGITHACIAPGSRSTPMALALTARHELSVSIHHDERSAAFAALGIGLARGRPAIVLTTSGTAAVHLHAAVVEADLARVPLLALTADRPPELQGVGAPQTIDQQQLYGRSVRAFIDAGVPDDTRRGEWRATAARAFGACVAPVPGPVQLNLPFREPLLGNCGPLPPPLARAHPAPTASDAAATIDPSVIDALVQLVDQRRGVLVAGWGVDDGAAVHRLADALGWPVLADARSGARLEGSGAIAYADALLRVDEWAAAHRPEIVVRIGDPWASKVVTQWLAAAELVAVDRHGVWIEPDRRAVLRVQAPASGLASALAPRVTAVDARWRDSWVRADRLAEETIAGQLAAGAPLSEPLIAATVATLALDHSAVVAASSMPVRDIEWYGGRRDRIVHYANRGANGIDGVVSTAIGVALTGRPVVALVGDLAFLHDSSALIALARRAIDLTIVVVDNDGGGIFSFLAQADVLDHDRFELLFGTPHGTDIAALARAHHLETEVVDTAEEFSVALMKATDAGGVRVIVARTDRAENVVVHRAIHDAVARAITA